MKENIIMTMIIENMFVIVSLIVGITAVFVLIDIMRESPTEYQKSMRSSKYADTAIWMAMISMWVISATYLMT